MLRHEMEFQLAQDAPGFLGRKRLIECNRRVRVEIVQHWADEG